MKEIVAPEIPVVEILKPIGKVVAETIGKTEAEKIGKELVKVGGIAAILGTLVLGAGKILMEATKE